MRSGQLNGNFPAITPAMIKICLDEYSERKKEELLSVCIFGIFQRESDVISQLSTFYNRLSGNNEYYLNQEELICLCRILIGRKRDEKSISGSVLARLEIKIGSQSLFICLTQLQKINFYNKFSWQFLMQWPDETLMDLKEKLINKNFIESIYILKFYGLSNKDLEFWLYNLNDADLGRVNRILLTLEKYRFLDGKFLALFFDEHEKVDSLLLKLLDDHYYFDDTYENRYQLFESLLFFLKPVNISLHLQQIKKLICLYQNHMFTRLNSFGVLVSSSTDVNRLFISLKKSGIHFDYSLIQLVSVEILRELDHLNIRCKFKSVENLQYIVSKYNREIMNLYLFGTPSLENEVIPFFINNDELLDSVASDIRKNPLPEYLFLSLYHYFQETRKEITKEHFFLINNLCKSMENYKNNYLLKNICGNNSLTQMIFLEDEFEFELLESAWLLLSHIEKFTKPVMDYLMQVTDAIIIVSTFRFSCFKNVDLVTYVADRMEIIRTKKILLELQKKSYLFFHLPDEILNKIAAFTGLSYAPLDGAEIARNVFREKILSS